MTKLPEPEPKLPDVSLSEIPERTKDFLIAHSATGKPVPNVIREILNDAARRAGFEPEPKAA